MANLDSAWTFDGSSATANPPRASQTVERLEAALSLAKRLGYQVRLDALGGDGGGGCEIQGQKWLFIDLSLTPGEQLEQALATLRHEAANLALRSSRLAVAPYGMERCAPELDAAEAAEPAESSEPVHAVALVPPGEDSPVPVLPRWRRWYRMLFGRRRSA